MKQILYDMGNFFFGTTTQSYDLIIMSFPGSIVTELARYIHLALSSGAVGGRWGSIFFMEEVIHRYSICI